MDKRLIDIKELSDKINVSISTLYTWCSQRRIPYVKFGKLTRFDLKDINEWIDRNRVDKRYEKDIS